MCFELFEKYGVENCKIYLVELYPCKSREELEAREGYYIRNYNCVNKIIPGRTKKEYKNDNKGIIARNKKEYYNDNKDIIARKLKEKHECECGGKYTHGNKSAHFKTKKHIQFIEQQNKDV